MPRPAKMYPANSPAYVPLPVHCPDRPPAHIFPLSLRPLTPSRRTTPPTPFSPLHTALLHVLRPTLPLWLLPRLPAPRFRLSLRPPPCSSRFFRVPHPHPAPAPCALHLHHAPGTCTLPHSAPRTCAPALRKALAYHILPMRSRPARRLYMEK